MALGSTYVLNLYYRIYRFLDEASRMECERKEASFKAKPAAGLLPAGGLFDSFSPVLHSWPTHPQTGRGSFHRRRRATAPLALLLFFPGIRRTSSISGLPCEPPLPGYFQSSRPPLTVNTRKAVFAGLYYGISRPALARQRCCDSRQRSLTRAFPD